ncbi:putative Ig domain-containing protein, partial [Pseudoalteromonas aurantia]
MSAVISGNGLGLFNSSVAMLGGQFDPGKAALGQVSEQVFVNAATGNLVIQGKDEQVKGLGLGLGIVRTYNSEGHFDGDNNDQWRLGFLKSINLEGARNSSGSVVTRTTADGYAQRFVYDSARKEYVSKAGSGADDTLTFNADGSATLKIDGTYTKEHYDAAGRLTAMQGPQGHQTTIEYTGERASSILTKTATGTEKTALIYNAQGLIEKLETQSGTSGANTRVYYGYDANKRLSSVKVDLTPADNSIADGKVYETKYTYDGSSNRVQSVSQSDGTTLTIGYEAHNGDYRVKSLTDGEGNQTLYNYVSATHTRVTIGGAQVDYHFDAEKRLTSVERIDNHQIVTQQYGYNTAGRLHSVTNGLGHQTQYGYDSEGNLTLQVDADGVTITRAYNSNNQLIKEQIGTDSTVYVYDTQQRLRFKLDADNTVVEYRYNTLGQRVSQHQYTNATYSSSVHSVTALEGFAASQKAHQQRSDYGYDFRGQLSSVSRYSSVSSQGVGSGQMSTTHYVYDAQGRLLQETTPEANSTHFSYDGLGRVLTKTTANQAVTAYTYDDANQRIGTRFASGLWQTEVFDKAGMVAWKAQGTGLGNNSYGTERLYRDEQGRVIAQQDAQGGRSYVLYDGIGQIAATVNNRGQVTRHHYDNAGQKVQTVEYAQVVSTAQWLSATGTLTQSLAQLDTQLAGMANHVDNRTSYTLYTAAGKPEYKIDADGFVTQHIYNRQGRLIEQKTYINAQNNNEISQLLTQHQLALETKSHQYSTSTLSNIQSQSEDNRFKDSGGIWRSNNGVYLYFVHRPINPVIDDNNFRLQFDDSVVPESLNFSSVGNDLLIHLHNGEFFTIKNGVSSWIDFSLNFWGRAETSLSKEYILSQLNEPTLNNASSGQDVVYGTYADDFIFGGKGNDLLKGSFGDDTYVYRKGDNVDIIQDIEGSNTLLIKGYDSDDFSLHEFIQYDEDHLMLLSDVSSDAIIINQFTRHWDWTIVFDDEQITLEELYHSANNRNNINLYLRTLGQTDTEFSEPVFSTWNNRPKNIFLYWGAEDNYFEFVPEGELSSVNGNVEAVVVGGAGDDFFEMYFDDDSTKVEYYGGKGDDYFYAMGNQVSHYHYSVGDGNDFIEGQTGDVLEFHDLGLDDIHITSNVVNNRGSIKFLVKSTGETVTYEVFGNTAKIQLKDNIFRTDNLPTTSPHFNQPELISSFETEIEVASDSRFVLPIRFDNVLESELSVIPISLPKGVTFDAKTRELSGVLSSNTPHVVVSFEAATKAHRNKVINLHIKNMDFIRLTDNLVSGDFDKVSIDYSATGKVEYKTDPEGYVTRYYYDAVGNEVAQRQYANKGTTASAQDRLSHTYYDGQGRVAGTLSADGALTTYTYTLAGQKQSQNVYHTQVRSQVIGGALAIPTGSKTTTSWTYTSTGQVERETRPDGSVEQYTYDKMGQLIEKQVYENAVMANGGVIANDNFTNNQLSGVFISNSGGSPITVKDERIEVKRLSAEASAWPSIRGNDYFNLSDNVEMRIEVTTGPTLAGSYLYGGIANDQSWGSGLLDRHAVYFTQNGVYSSIVENSKSQPHQLLMTTQPNTTYVVTWTTSENETTLTVYPKGHPEQAVSRTESAVERSDKASRLIMYGNPRPGANNSVLYLENYSLGYQTHNVERYQYDQLGRLVSTLDGNQNAVLGANATDAQIASAASQQGAHIEYDILGNIRISKDREGAQTRYYYDAQGNQRFEIDAQGQVTEYRYNAFNERTDVLRYHTVLSASDISSAGLIGGLVTNTVTGGKTVAQYLIDKVASGEAFHEQLAYNTRGLVALKTDAQGYETRFAYNAFAQLAKQSQQSHASLLDKQRHDAGKQITDTTFNYDGRGLLTSTVVSGAGLSQTSSKTYDAFGRAVTVTDGNGNPTTVSHSVDIASDKAGRKVVSTQTVDGATRTIETLYDMLGRTVSVKNATGDVTRYQYDDEANSITVTQPNGTSVKTTRNALGKVASVAQFDAAGIELSVSTYHYDKNANLVETRLNGQVQTSTEFDKNNRAHRVTDTNGHQVETQYDEVGRVVAKIVDPQGLKLTTSFEHNNHGAQVIKTEQINTVVSGGKLSGGTQNKTITEFDSNGQATSVKVLQGNVVQSQTSYDYDGTGKKLYTTQGSGSHAVSTGYEYDALGRLVKTEKGNEVTTYQYDDNDNVIKKVTQLDTQRSHTQLFDYNEANQLIGHLTSVDSANNYQVVRYSYDNNGQRIGQHRYGTLLANPQVNTVHGTVETFATSHIPVSEHTAYDDTGRKSLHIDANGGVTQWQYDAQGRVYEVIRWGQRASISDLSKLKDGTLTASDLVKFGPIDADSKVKTLYNDKGQARFTLTLQTGNSASIKESRYDAAGQLVETIAYANTVNYSAITNEGDANTQVQALSSAQDQQSQLFYDNAGRLRFTVDALGYVSEQRYNEVSDVNSSIAHGISVVDNATLKAKLTANTLSYADLQGHYGSSVLTHARVSSSEYNAAGQLIWTQHADGTTESYTYNNAGLKTSYTNQNNATWTYDYDDAGRLAFERSPAQTIFNWANGQLSKLTSVNITKALSYDGLGNVIQITEGAQKNKTWVSGVPTATTHFVYDSAGRQIAVRQAATTNAPATETITKYDALGRAVSSTQAGVTQVKVYDNAGNVRFEIDGEGNVTERRFNALGQVVTLVKYADELTWQPNSTFTPTFADMVDSQGHLKTNNPVNLKVSADKDRQIDTQYDAAGRKSQVTIGNQTTLFTYNAFNQAIKKEQLLAVGSLTSYTYYNALGQTVATVDAGKYLTTQSYNAFGQVETRTEYAAALTGNLSETSQPTGTAGNATVGHNRQTHFHYDDMGRVTHEVKANIQVAEFTSGMSFETRSHVVGITAYDDLGNVIQTQQKTANSADISKLSAGTSDSKAWEYDAVGRLTHTAKSWVSNTTVDTQKSLTHGAISSASGRQVTSMGYDVFGNLVSQRAHSVRGSFNTQSLDITAPADNSNDKTTRHEYNSRGQLVAEYDALGNKTAHYYNAMGQLEQTRQTYHVMAEVAAYSFSYTAREVDGDGTVISSAGERLPVGFVFNAQSGVITQNHRTDAQYTITIKANSAHISAINDRTQSYSFNQAGKSVQVRGWQAAETDGEQTRFTKYSYFKDGQVRSKTVGHNNGSHDISNATWNTYYNAFGEVKKDDDGVYVYNQQGQLWKTTKGDGVLKTHSYDKAGRLTNTDHALNGATDIERDALGQAIKITQPEYNGQRGVLTQKHDRWGNTLEIVDTLGYATRAQYNYQNKVIKETLPIVSVVNESGVARYDTPENVFHYDESGNLVAKIDANGYQHTFKYSANGEQLYHKDAQGHITSQQYDIFGRKVATVDAQGRTTTSEYDKLDRVVETGQFGVVNGQSGQYRMTNAYDYDALGNRTDETDAMGGVKSYKFDVHGNVNYSRDEIGREKTYLYDKRGNQRLEEYSSLYRTGNVHKNTRNFDEYGNLQSGNDLGGKGFTYSYGKSFGEDNRIATLTNVGGHDVKTDIGRLVRKQNDHGQDIKYTYYSNGWLKSITDTKTEAYSEFKYDAAGRRTVELKQSWDDLQRVIRHETRTAYDSHGRIALTETQAYNNTSGSSGAPNWVAGDIISRVTYQYDAVGNRRSMKVENGLTGEITPRRNALKLEPNLTFARGSSGVSKGAGNIKIYNDFGVDVTKLKVLFYEAGRQITQPKWLKIIQHGDSQFTAVDRSTAVIRFEQSAEIPRGQKDFEVRFEMKDANNKTLHAKTDFKLTDNVQVNSDVGIPNGQFIEGENWSVPISADWFIDNAKKGLKYSIISSYGGPVPNPVFPEEPVFVLGADKKSIVVRTIPGTTDGIKMPAGTYLMTLSAISNAESGGSIARTFTMTVVDNKAPVNKLPTVIEVGEGSDPLDLADYITDEEGNKLKINFTDLSGVYPDGTPALDMTTDGTRIGVDEVKVISEGSYIPPKEGFAYNRAGTYEITGKYADAYSQEKEFKFTLKVRDVNQSVGFTGISGISHKIKVARGQQLTQGGQFNVNMFRDSIVDLDGTALKFSFIFKQDLSKVKIAPNNADDYDSYTRLQEKIRTGEIRSVASELGIIIDSNTGVLSGKISDTIGRPFHDIVLVVHEEDYIKPLSVEIPVEITGPQSHAVYEGARSNLLFSLANTGFEAVHSARILQGPSFVTLRPDFDGLEFNPGQKDAGFYRVKVEVVEEIADHLSSNTANTTSRHTPIGQTRVVEFDVEVIAVNAAPVVWNASRQLSDIKDDQEWSFGRADIGKSFIDPDGDTLTYSVVSKPAFMTWDQNSEVLSTNKSLPGTYTIVVRATDSGGLYADADLKLTVIDTNRAPVGSMPPMTIEEGESINLNYGQYFSDPDSDPLTTQFTIYDVQKGGLFAPEGTQFNPNTGTLTGTLSYKSAGEYQITAQVSDGEVVINEVTSLKIIDAPEPIPPQAIVVNEGQELDFWLSSGHTGFYHINSARIISGPDFVSPISELVRKGLKFTPGQTDAGLYKVSVEVIEEITDPLHDNALSASSATFNRGMRLGRTRVIEFDINVVNVNVAPTAVKNNVQLPTVQDTKSWTYGGANITSLFTDVDGDTLSYSVISKPSWVNWDQATKTLSANNSVAGEHSIRVRAKDAGGQYADVTLAITVITSNRSPVGNMPSRVISEGSYASINYSQYFSDPDNDTLSYKFWIYDPNTDNHGAPAGMSFNSRTGTLAGTPNYNSAGTYEIKAEVSDGKAVHTSVVNLIVLNSAPPVPVPVP